MHDTLFLFGATGDLAQRYLFPSLLRLLGDGLLPEDFRIRALALSGHDTEAFHDILRPASQIIFADAAVCGAMFHLQDIRPDKPLQNKAEGSRGRARGRPPRSP